LCASNIALKHNNRATNNSANSKIINYYTLSGMRPSKYRIDDFRADAYVELPHYLNIGRYES